MNGARVFGYSRSTMDKPVITKVLENMDQQQLLKMFEGYDIKFTNSYDIGLIGDKVNYFDMVKKEK